MLHYDAILFDVDGTLIDSAPGILHTLEEVFQKMGVDVTGVNLRRYLGPPLRKSFGEHFTELDKIEQATRLYRESYAVKGSHECAAYPGAAEMLQRLKDAGLILCTARITPAYAGKRLKKSHSIGHFSCILCLFHSVLHRASASGGSRAGPCAPPCLPAQNAVPM